MFKKFLPNDVQKYLLMSKRQRAHEIQLTIWFMPFLYICLSLLLVACTLFLDLKVELSHYVPKLFSMNASVTRTLVSTLIGGVLTLSAFTLNSLLVVLTTFSGQFSPRMLLNFISDKKTQHALGIFNGSFVFVLFNFLFIGSSKKEMFTAAPVLTVIVAFIAAITFIFFINHASTWMQVHNITYNMKKVSEVMINQTLKKDLECHRTKDDHPRFELDESKCLNVKAKASGYVQLIDFHSMIEKAREDGIIVRLHFKIGDFVLCGNNLICLYGADEEKVDVEKYLALIEIGHKETEIQDLQMGMHKLAEVAIKSLGNDDPKTASNTIHQITDLMLTINHHLSFSPYLIDDDEDVRVILEIEDFDYYLYRGFGYVRHYARGNHLIITDIVKALSRLSETLPRERHQCLWDFAANTIDHIEESVIYELDKTFLLTELKILAKITGHTEEYQHIHQKFYPDANRNV
ncbi:DUF2254 domain-containing protein [Rossellomorea marisflavi]|uniref:DUF2254 domain-containing protein n=1 Tax=Rossellomorea marisflavi TaxID=189381 RepID=UPI001EE2DBB9|nr:DUF2254 family protein [Rossellomorea marisflavi]UKS64585.1 DUF2254 domain-containing protein [Rossellomorea marisflavi]